MITYTVKVYPNGTKLWYVDGKLHREDGPAVEYYYRMKYYWLNGKYVSKEEHSRLTKQSCDGTPDYRI